jgi:uncharacterized protein (UPF0262 family)
MADITDVTFNEQTILMRNEEIAHEKEKVVSQLLESSSFQLPGHTPPFTLLLSVEGGHWILDVLSQGAIVLQISVPYSPFRRLMKDYALICESYHQAIENAFDPSKVEAIDMGRRGLHNEGAEMLLEYIEPKAKPDFETARKLFTLFYVLHMR